MGQALLVHNINRILEYTYKNTTAQIMQVNIRYE